MAQKITMQADGTLSVPDEPIIPYVEGDGTGIDIWPAAQLVMDEAAAKHGKKIEWKEVLAGQKAFDATGSYTALLTQLAFGAFAVATLMLLVPPAPGFADARARRGDTVQA